MTKLNVDNAKKILNDFENKTILVIGDFYLDEYIETTSDQFSPEAPVPRAIVKSKIHVPGAAGNVACVLKELGAIVKTVGVIGADNNGNILKSNLDSRGINTQGLILDKNRLTGTFSRILLLYGGNISQHVIRFDHENDSPLSQSTRKQVISHFREQVKSCDAIFMADYDETGGTGLINDELMEEIIGLAKPNNVLTVGISRLNIKKFKDFDLIITNEKETEIATNIKITDDKTLLKAVENLKTNLKSKVVLASLGKKGAIVMDEFSTFQLPSFAKKVVDVCGAGDTMSSAFALSKLSNATHNEALEIGSFAASVAVQKEGTATVSRSELLSAIKNEYESINKLVTPVQLSSLVKGFKKQGKKVVLTNGYFDFIHAGIIQFLQEAKKHGDILIVALNSDESTRSNKGADRPLLNQGDRAKIMSAFSFVDYVVIFEELTPIKLIQTLHPDVLVKGGTYAKEEVVGKDLFEDMYVKALPLMGPSTESMIDFIKNSKKSLHEK